MPDFKQAHVGGSFAPPLSDKLLGEYKKKIDELEASPVKDALEVVLNCCEKWWKLPEAKDTLKTPHASGRGLMVSLQDDQAKALEKHIPWSHELEGIAGVFDTIDPEKDKGLRDAAFHLLWHVKELDLGREPLTSDQL